MKNQFEKKHSGIPRLIAAAGIMVFFLSASGCGDTGTSGVDTDAGTYSNIATDIYTESVGGADSASYNALDIAENYTFSDTVSINLAKETVESSIIDPTGFSSSAVSAGNGVTVESNNDEIIITSTGTGYICYTLSGSGSKTLSISSASAFKLSLNGAVLSAENGPALNISSSVRAFIESVDGTVNELSDNGNRSDSLDQKAALYSEGTLIFCGTGSLEINADYKHGIVSSGYIRILEGTLEVNVSARDAIRSSNGFIFDDGNLTISATGTTVDDESKGINVKGDESTSGAGMGYIIINGGTIKITSVSKGITASWDIDDDADTASTDDDPDPDVIINNGKITIATTGDVYDTGEASCSPEGIEGKDSLTVNNGYLTIVTADDCLNAGTDISIKGGYIYCKSTDSDAVDSNGTLHISGGVITAIGSGAPEGAFDCDQNTFSITGGTLIGTGGSTSTPTASAITQNTVIMSGTSFNSGDILSVFSSDETCVMAYEMPSGASNILFSCPELESSETYSVYAGGTADSDSVFNGLYLDNLICTGGSFKSSFTINSTVTTSGGTPNGPN